MAVLIKGFSTACMITEFSHVSCVEMCKKSTNRAILPVDNFVDSVDNLHKKFYLIPDVVLIKSSYFIFFKLCFNHTRKFI